MLKKYNAEVLDADVADNVETDATDAQQGPYAGAEGEADPSVEDDAAGKPVRVLAVASDMVGAEDLAAAALENIHTVLFDSTQNTLELCRPKRSASPAGTAPASSSTSARAPALSDAAPPNQFRGLRSRR